MNTNDATRDSGGDGLTVERPEPAVLRIVLDRPAVLNAVSVAVREDLLQLLRSIGDGDTHARAVILTGRGERAFCSGGDVREFEGFLGPRPVDGYRAQMRFQEMAALLLQLPCPVITAINGPALGGGTAIALMSDLRLASSHATFAVGQVARGLVPDVGLTYLLPRVVGLGKAMELMMLNEPVDADEAARIGLVNRVVPSERLQDEAFALASSLAKRSAPSLEWIKRTTYQNLDLPMEAALRHEAAAQAIVSHTEEFREGIAAFEARGPEYRDGAR